MVRPAVRHAVTCLSLATLVVASSACRETGTILVKSITFNGTEFDFDAAPAKVEDGARYTDRLNVSGDVRVAGGKFKATLPPRSASVFTMR